MGMGRPKLQDETKRKTNITIRLDEHDRKYLSELAKELNLSSSYNTNVNFYRWQNINS